MSVLQSLDYVVVVLYPTFYFYFPLSMVTNLHANTVDAQLLRNILKKNLNILTIS